MNRERQLDEAVTAYLLAVEAGPRPEHADWLARYPDLADELAEFFADESRLARTAAPLRLLAVTPERSGDTTTLPAAQGAALVEQLARGMHAAHQQGVIHRDLKPANVLLGGDGSPKVTDFGLAKKLDEVGRTATGAVMGTPSYMAPEQAGGKSKELGPACDIYALGAVLYQCLTGRPPFRAATSLDTLLQVMEAEPVAPSQ